MISDRHEGTAAPVIPIDPLESEVGEFLAAIRLPPERNVREWACDELVIPEGDYAGRRFRIDVQPYTGLLYDAIDSNDWLEVALTGPTQSGKTLCGFVAPLAFHLFEKKENVVLGLPDMDMAADKWSVDVRPAIEATDYREQLPSSGQGSRGGTPDLIEFRNGAKLKIMSGGAKDKGRAGFTSRVLVVTEADGLAEAGENSVESSKLKQLVARTRRYGRRARRYYECTVSIETGLIWQFYVKGTHSVIVSPCPHCRRWVAPERQHFVEWDEAHNRLEAEKRGHWVCPQCGHKITDKQRAKMVARSLLVHKGQRVSDRGKVTGDIPPTRRLGFRWTAFHNLFIDSPDLAGDLWELHQEHDEDLAEREVCQFIFAIPYTPPEIDLTRLNAEAVEKRTDTGYERFVIPKAAKFVTVGVDVSKYLLHIVCTALDDKGTGVIFDYDVYDVPTSKLAFEIALRQVLGELADRLEAGFTREGTTQRDAPALVLIDANWEPSRQEVYAFCRKRGGRFMPARGYGVRSNTKLYTAPRKKTKVVVKVGHRWHVVRDLAERVHVLHVDANFYKSYLAERLHTTAGEPGSLELFAIPPRSRAHQRIARAFASEEAIEEYDHKKGRVIVWRTLSRTNHYFDAAYLSCTAANALGLQITEEPEPPISGSTQTTARALGPGRMTR